MEEKLLIAVLKWGIKEATEPESRHLGPVAREILSKHTGVSVTIPVSDDAVSPSGLDPLDLKAVSPY